MEEHQRLWSRARLGRLSLTILSAIVLTIGFAVLAPELFSSPSGIFVGDFPAFYSAGVLARQGELSALYSPLLQQQVQYEFFPHLAHGEGGFYPFAYPPYVALLCIPLSWASPSTAAFLFTVLQMGVLWGTAVLFTRLLPFRALSFAVPLALLLLFAPIFVGVTGGQNVAVSCFLFLFALLALPEGLPASRGAASTNLRTERLRSKWLFRQVLGGLAVGLWLFKPQLALPFLVLLLLFRLWYSLLAACGVGALYYLSAALLYGVRWPAAWFDIAAHYSEAHLPGSAHQMTSLLGGGYFFAREFHLFPEEVLVQRVLWLSGFFSLLGFCLLYGLFARSLARQRFAENPLSERSFFTGTWCCVGVVAPLLSLHTVFYDLGLAGVAFLAFFGVGDDRSVAQWLALCVLSWVALFSRSAVSFPCFFLLSLIFLALYLWNLKLKGLRDPSV
ncbi:glycosyltransferase 87 family protein [bacterium]|nr:glycosyltransferase 87 family protein [bacterium]